MHRTNRGHLFVISGPSGAGKGTVLKKVFAVTPRLCYSISCTTRPPRDGERDGAEYFFLTEDEFQRRVEAGDFLEYANVHGHHYGTLLPHVHDLMNTGNDVLLEIDVQGALNVMRVMPECISVFIMPPSLTELEKRLRGRATESEPDIELRMKDAAAELSLRGHYRYVLVNDNVDAAAWKLSRIIRASRYGKVR